MNTVGIIAEYNPLHRGHQWQLAQTRVMLGEDTAIICAMSGDYVQRGDFAILGRRARAEAAVRSGADLVLELPLPWAVASAERFADGGVQVLEGTGVVEHLLFGSECGDAAALMKLARALTAPAADTAIRKALESGASYAAARQAAAEQLTTSETAALLSRPNNLLGVEYCKAILRRNSPMKPITLARQGMEHDGSGEGFASGSRIRELVRAGELSSARAEMAPAMVELYNKEAAAGRAPVLSETCERAMLARLRGMDEADFAALDESREGLYHRLYEASRQAVSVEELLQQAKTKRYAYARLRRMVLWAYLGLRPGELPEQVPYLRLLAANSRGREVLATMRKRAALPILTKPADVRQLGAEAQAVFELEARAVDLYALAYPELKAAAGGSLWRSNPVIVE